ncbi:MAG: phage tail protein [Sphingomonadaceae bacterium]
MATLVLGALGTLFGGPLGGAIGALAGRQLDAAIIGSPTREGPRLKDLAITTSSYGQPIARVFGQARVAGTIIWATDLIESRSTSGGGKGKPKVTSFSYSSSFAVALSSRPVSGIGRVWADGQLIRGAAGDLKVGGTMRIYCGHADQLPDPLMAAALGPACPAHRGLAYVVFEHLQLADFGNRIPALSFEVFADDAPLSLAAVLEPLAGQVETDRTLDGLRGFEQESGALRDTLALLDVLFPTVADIAGGGLRLDAPDRAETAITLSASTTGPEETDFGHRTGRASRRANAPTGAIGALRYYDPARDFQTGIQRLEGGAGAGAASLDFPAVLDAAVARQLLRAAWVRATGRSTSLRWRIAEIDPAVAPGRAVLLPDRAGAWLVTEWEWRDGGIELGLERIRVGVPNLVPSDPGQAPGPPDLALAPSWLRAFELPLDGTDLTDRPRRFLAASSATTGWTGAELLADLPGGLVSVGASGRLRATVGTLAAPLAASASQMLDYTASLEVDLIGADMALAPASIRALAAGANRMLIGTEVLQFLEAVPLAGSRWRLDGLLRGRGGTERAAQLGHPAGTGVTLLNDALLPVGQLSPEAAAATSFLAAGLADTEPPVAALENAGTSLKPIHPVHPRQVSRSNGGLLLRWTRRARGAWAWNDEVDVPLVEQAERYLVGTGPVDRPAQTWETSVSYLELSAAETASIMSGQPVWVRQIGSHALSDAVLLRTHT